MILRLTGNCDLTTLSQVLDEVASFCGDDSQVELSGVPIKLGIAQFVESSHEQRVIAESMLNALAKYGVQATLVEEGGR